MNDSILNIAGLTKKYDRFSLKDVSFSIPRGYIMGFVGQNGAGKSTTIKCIMNLIEYEKGSIQVMGMDNRVHFMEIRNRIGYVSEDVYFYEEMTVEWTGEFFGSFYSGWDKKHFYELLHAFKIDKRKKIKELSKGMKMKLSLALALSHKAELLILDEPTSGLDPVVRSEILEIFMNIIQDENCSILFSSHITTDIEKVADFVTVIDDGRIILSDEKDNILNNWKVIKAENSFLNEHIEKSLIGMKKGEFGFSGVTDDVGRFSADFKKQNPHGTFKSEKITLDELLVRFVRDGENCA
ncbi:MAG: ABC transporter ATP-binding protein [Clostridia bacterium]|nr:ABC transporter ATP-binding protein [Clostridia bacterium]